MGQHKCSRPLLILFLLFQFRLVALFSTNDARPVGFVTVKIFALDYDAYDSCDVVLAHDTSAMLRWLSN